MDGDAGRVTDHTAAYVRCDLDAICVLIEQAQRVGVYGGTAAFDALMKMPEQVHSRLMERANVRTERLLSVASAEAAHRDKKPHDAALCTWCLINEADMRRATQ